MSNGWRKYTNKRAKVTAVSCKDESVSLKKKDQKTTKTTTTTKKKPGLILRAKRRKLKGKIGMSSYGLQQPIL